MDSSLAERDRMLSATTTRGRKPSTGGALSARSSRHAGLLSRSHAISSKLGTTDIVGRRADILAAPQQRAATSQRFGSDYRNPFPVKETPHGLGGRAWGSDQRGQLDRLSRDLGARVQVLVAVQACRPASSAAAAVIRSGREGARCCPRSARSASTSTAPPMSSTAANYSPCSPPAQRSWTRSPSHKHPGERTAVAINVW